MTRAASAARSEQEFYFGEMPIVHAEAKPKRSFWQRLRGKPKTEESEFVHQ